MGIGRVGVGWVREILFAAISLEKIAHSKCFIQITNRCHLLTEYLIEGLSMFQLNGKNRKARVLCSTTAD